MEPITSSAPAITGIHVQSSKFTAISRQMASTANKIAMFVPNLLISLYNQVAKAIQGMVNAISVKLYYHPSKVSVPNVEPEVFPAIELPPNAVEFRDIIDANPSVAEKPRKSWMTVKNAAIAVAPFAIAGLTYLALTHRKSGSAIANTATVGQVPSAPKSYNPFTRAAYLLHK